MSRETEGRPCREQTGLCDTAWLTAKPAKVSSDDERALARFPPITRSENSPVTAAEARALTRSEELRTLRGKLWDLEREQRVYDGRDEADPVKPKRDESPQQRFERQQAANRKVAANAKRMVQQIRSEHRAVHQKMQPLIERHGGPWTPEEHPLGPDAERGAL
jgi:hypothetical protein